VTMKNCREPRIASRILFFNNKPSQITTRNSYHYFRYFMIQIMTEWLKTVNTKYLPTNKPLPWHPTSPSSNHTLNVMDIHNMFCSYFQITTRKYPTGNVYVHNFCLTVTAVTLYIRTIVCIIEMFLRTSWCWASRTSRSWARSCSSSPWGKMFRSEVCRKDDVIDWFFHVVNDCCSGIT
jgi:hypothetical protein